VDWTLMVIVNARLVYWVMKNDIVCGTDCMCRSIDATCLRESADAGITNHHLSPLTIHAYRSKRLMQRGYGRYKQGEYGVWRFSLPPTTARHDQEDPSTPKVIQPT